MEHHALSDNFDGDSNHVGEYLTLNREYIDKTKVEIAQAYSAYVVCIGGLAVQTTESVLPVENEAGSSSVMGSSSEYPEKNAKNNNSCYGATVVSNELLLNAEPSVVCVNESAYVSVRSLCFN